LNIQHHLEQTGAHLKGHFLLSSGLHSDQYFQCAKLLQYPDLAEQAGAALAEIFKTEPVDVVVAPAMGGLIIGHEVARALGVRFVFGERAGEENKLAIRRGFEITPGERVLLVEDVITTGGSILELRDLITSFGGKIAGFASVVDRTSQPVDFGAPYRALIKVRVNTYKPDSCPFCAQGSKPVKPGSRKI